MEWAVRAAKIGNRVISAFAFLLILLMLSYGGYSLWDNYQIMNGAFLTADLLKYKPTEADGEEHYSLEELAAINPDVRGWLTIDNTNIDYPFVQGASDMTYVNQDVMGDFSLSGAIFLSCMNSSDLSDTYNLLYGHHMDNGGMFGDVMEFLDADYFESHKTGTMSLMRGGYFVEVFACLETDAYDSLVYNPGPSYDTAELLAMLKQKAINYREIGVTKNDKIIAMSTCVDAVTNGRAVLFARLTDVGSQ